MKPIDLIVRNIRDLDTDRLAMQRAFFMKDLECERLRKIIHRLKKKLNKKIRNKA